MKSHNDDDDFESAASGTGQFKQHLLLVLWQRKMIVIFGITTGLILAALYYAQVTPMYQSSSQVLVVKKRANEAASLGNGDPRVTVMDDYLTTHITLLKSPIVAERAVKKRDLQMLPSLAGSDNPAAVIASSLGVARDKEGGSAGGSNVINMTYRGTSPDDCKTILGAIIESYKDFLDETYRNFSDDTLELITRGREVLHKDLDEKKTAYRKFREKSPLIWVGKDGLTTQQERISGIERQRSTLLMQQANLRDRIKNLEAAIASNRPRAELLAMVAPRLDSKDKPGHQDPIEAQLIPLLLQEQQLLDTYGPEHADVIAVRKRIATLRELLKKYGGGTDGLEAEGDPVERYLQRLRRELHEAESDFNAQSELLKNESVAAREFAAYQMDDENYRTQIASSQALYDGIIKRLQEISLIRESGGFDARPISRPGPGVKVAPNPFQIFLCGLVVGLALGVGLAYLAELSDKGFRTADEIRRRLGMAVIGHIPLLSPDPESQQKVKAGEPTLDPFLCTCYRPKSVEAEAFRAVRTALYFSTQGAGHKVIQVTSPDMGDGKSTLITNLAVCIAQSGKKIIVIDADLRRPRLHRMFALQAPCGLAGVIAGTVDWRDAVQATAIPNLFIMPCGPLPSNPAELLTSPVFQEVLAAARAEYDIVLVDTPPLLAVTDPCVVAPRVDGVVLTLRLSKKGGPKAERAREMLAALGVKVLGVVVNGVTARTGVGRYGGGAYEYGYGQNEYTTQAEDSDESYYDNADEEAPAGGTKPLPKPSELPRRSVRSPGIKNHGMLSWLLRMWM